MSRSNERIQTIPVSRARDEERTKSSPGAVRNPAWERELELGFRGRWYSLSRDELRVLHDVAAFRVVDREDLVRLACAGDPKRLDHALGQLESKGLIQTRKVYSPETRSELELVSARSHGAKLMRSAKSMGDEQEFFHGFVKPREAFHDSTIYRMYEIEAHRIAREGGTVSRVILDFELKRQLFTRISARKEDWKEPESEARKVVAERLELPIVNDRITLPDLRIEYTDASGARAHVDLELATEHYKTAQLAAKAQAGFRIYTCAAGAVPHEERKLRLFEL
jgi:hypothetical protein